MSSLKRSQLALFAAVIDPNCVHVVGVNNIQPRTSLDDRHTNIVAALPIPEKELSKRGSCSFENVNFGTKKVTLVGSVLGVEARKFLMSYFGGDHRRLDEHTIQNGQRTKQ